MSAHPHDAYHLHEAEVTEARAKRFEAARLWRAALEELRLAGDGFALAGAHARAAECWRAVASCADRLADLQDRRVDSLEG